MTWEEFKKEVEKAGVKGGDEIKIIYIVTDGCFLSCDYDEDYGWIIKCK